MPTTARTITLLLREAHEGKAAALNRVMEIVYEDLHRMAQRHVRAQLHAGDSAITLEPRALLNETFLKLVKQRTRFDNRGHFFAIATRVMLRVLMDHHRKRAAGRRWGGMVRVSLGGLAAARAAPDPMGIPDFVETIERLHSLDQRTADVAKMRVVWGLTIAEIAEALGVSRATVEREWRFGRRWLADALGSGEHR